jgi:hypothetical protein
MRASASIDAEQVNAMSHSRSTARVNTMQTFRLLLAALGIAGALALAGCNDEGTSAFAGTATSSSSGATVVPTISSITLLESSPNLPSDNSKPVTITAIARDASNQLVPGAVIDFIASSGGILPVQTTAGSTGTTKVAAGTTDANGIAQATLTTPGDFANRSITVTAISGGATATIDVSVVGTTLTLTGASTLISGDSGTYTVALSDAGNNGISGQQVTVASTAGNKLSTNLVATDALGHASFQVTGSVAGNDTIKVSALGQSATQALTVSGQSFSFAAPMLSTLPLGQSENLTVTWTNSGTAQSNSPVTFSTTRGTVNGASTVTINTGMAGTATITVSSTTAGPAIVTATAGSGATAVATQVPLTFVATVPYTIDVQASPATIPVQGQSTITAIVRDALNNLVSGETVYFQLADVTNGSISVGSAVTDLQGQAQTVYTATTTPSAANGVTVTASFLPALVAPGVSTATVNLTVGGQTLFLSLGTGSIVGENAQKTQFQLPYVVQAVDAGGNPVANVTLTMKVEDLPPPAINPQLGPAPNTWNALSASSAAYAKGVYVKNTSQWVQNIDAYCLNEDVAGTGVYVASNDLNHNMVLDPGGVATVSPSPVTTDSTGTANITIYYPEDAANWVQVRLTATATVAGTQTSTSAVFWLPILASYLTNTSATPPGYYSPYGYGAGLSYTAALPSNASSPDLSAAQLAALFAGTAENASCSDPQ